MNKTLSYISIFILFILTTTNAQKSFTCNSTTKCNSIIDYISPNATTILKLTTLFGISKNLPSYLGANNLPSTTPPSFPIKANQTVKIPFPCRCSNGTGASDGLPIYKVVKDDGLYHIAAEVFAGLILYPQIQNANNIPDANNISVGQELKIPLPCSCDEVDGEVVVHYGHVVPAGSTVEGIAKEFDTTQETLLKLNALSSPRDLIAGSVLDVPLKACKSEIRNTSLDYPLLVTNGSYIFTAGNCVQCKCDAANNYILQCEQSKIRSSIWPSCPNTRCNNLFLGNTTSSGCNRTTCAYEGYNNRTIFTNLATDSTCAVPPTPGSAPPTPSPGSAPPTPGSAPPTPSSATKTGSQGWRWNFLLVAVQLVLLSLHLFQ